MKNKIQFIICLLFGLMFINSGLNKIFNYIPVPEDLPEDMKKLNIAFETITWLMPLVAIVEIVGAVLFISNKYRALGAIILLPIMIGIMCLHLFNFPQGLPMALIFFAIHVWILVINREKYYAMIR